MSAHAAEHPSSGHPPAPAAHHPHEITIGGDSSLGYRLFSVTVKDIIRGVAPKTVTVSMATTDDGKALTIPGRPVPELGDQAIWFLRQMDPRFGIDAYVLTSAAGSLLVEGDDGLMVTGHSPALEQAEQLGSLDRVAAEVSR